MKTKPFTWYFSSSSFNNNEELEEHFEDGWEILKSLGCSSLKSEDVSHPPKAVNWLILVKREKDDEAGSMAQIA